jgi:hypothetical protein
MVIYRLNELLQESLAAICFEASEEEFPEYTSNAFALVVILRHEAGYFKRSLRNRELFSVSYVSLLII